MKRTTAIINHIAISFNQIEVSLSGLDYSHYINSEDVNWFPINNQGNSIKGQLQVGTTIEFDSEINNKTRNLKNVEIKQLKNNIMKTTNLEKCNEMLIKYTSGQCIYDEFIHFLKIEGLNQMNEFGSLTSEFSINWDKLECATEGFTKKQELEADSLIDDYSKQLLDINNIAHNIIIK